MIRTIKELEAEKKECKCETGQCVWCDLLNAQLIALKDVLKMIDELPCNKLGMIYKVELKSKIQGK